MRQSTPNIPPDNPACTTDVDRWQFWIDRGGTFTDVVARRPDGRIVSHKLLSENPEQYRDAAIQGIRDLMGIPAKLPLPSKQIAVVKMGTTVATNALLERQGEPTLLVITEGFADALRIGYQSRPRLFDLNIQLPEMIYSRVLEVTERIGAHGDVLQPLNEQRCRQGLQRAYDEGLRAVAIVFMHAYRYPQHEQQVAALARDIGFTQVSASARISPLMKLVSRGDTTVVDAYLSPILRRYVEQVEEDLKTSSAVACQLLFMQSNGGLTEAHHFQGKDAILSGPAGGVVGMVGTARAAGFEQLIGFDMGGTSTDVCHYAGQYERAFETEVAGVRLRAPMMQIHTVAAGGGSILYFDGARFRVGPDSAGARPGPACYRNGGPLTVTDCNVMLGKLQPELFPSVFGTDGKQPLDAAIVEKEFVALASRINSATGVQRSAVQVAAGFLAIAVENMANAIKKVSVQRGYDVTRYTLCCFGGAGGQHACLVADTLGMKRIYLHPLAGVLSAFGMGLADLRWVQEQSMEVLLDDAALAQLGTALATLQTRGETLMQGQGVAAANLHSHRRLHVRYSGSDTALTLRFDKLPTMTHEFEQLHRQRFGFITADKALIVEAVQVEVVGTGQKPDLQALAVAHQPHDPALPLAHHPVYLQDDYQNVPFYAREQLPIEKPLLGPAIIVEQTGTIVVEAGWQAQMTPAQDIILERYLPLPQKLAIGTTCDPVMLEIFNNLFMSIAEQMGSVLENTACSVNIKERLDFSCAIFDQQGDLIANAPHLPVHLGSMSQSIKTVIRENTGRMHKGDAWLLNAPYNGGTHLPDITVIKPVLDDDDNRVLFYIASRAHHADIGGITPGSMPSNSNSVEQEGILIDNFKLVSAGQFQEQALRALLLSGPYPARSPDTNIADLRAQIAACEKGLQELRSMVSYFGLDVVWAYMQHVQDNAEESVRRVLGALKNGQFCYKMDDGSLIQVAIRLAADKRSAQIDFTGTSTQHAGNFNAPSAICTAAVLYVFRCLVDDDIPLNEGCLKPLHIINPADSMLNPSYPAAVVAGNVETSQAIVDTLFGALGVAAASQGTMNNFTWGDETFQYYETICGGSGATATGDGTDAIHSHMTNTRLTDPEVLEWRYPVLLEAFQIRPGSGGGGKYHGGDGVIRRLRFLQAMSVNILSGHRRIPPYGMAGGEPGKTGCNTVLHPDGSQTHLSGTDHIQVHAGDIFVIATPGGGGYGIADPIVQGAIE
ncbi:MAG TPA: 5-oxoprolinase [Gammaproteobacteria bacterium]|nr:5-oxoprolinase [Gammaproteobacteria bacterium]